MKKLILLLLLPLVFLIKPISAQAETQIPERPTNGIYDPQNYVTNKVSNRLAEFNSSSDTQIGVYIVDTLDGKNIDEQANAIAKAWQIGYTDTNKGVLIAIAIKDRKFRIETSNEASKYLTKNNIDSILNSSKSYMRKQDYDGAIINMIDSIAKYIKTNNQPKKENNNQGLFQFENNSNQDKHNHQDEHQVKNNAYEEYQQKQTIKILKIMAVVGGLMGLIMGLPSVFDVIKKLSYKKRSKFTYKGQNKLTPKDSNFQPNKTWTDERIRAFWKTEFKNRSQFTYSSSDKLYPGDINFIDNSSWTVKRIEDYKQKKADELARKLEEEKRQKEERLKRSQYDYQGEDKLYPNNANFVSNDTWTTLLIANYLSDLQSQNNNDYHSSSHSSYNDYSSSSYSSSFDSSSSWSSSDWGGGGFDGGGSSGDW